LRHTGEGYVALGADLFAGASSQPMCMLGLDWRTSVR